MGGVIPQRSHAPVAVHDEPLTKDRVFAVALFVLAGLGIAACAWIVVPFIPALTWATALCVLASPLQGRIARKGWSRDIAAALTTTVVTLAILIPAIFVTISAAQQASEGVQEFERHLKADGGVEGIISRNRIAATAFQWTKSHVDWDNEMKELRSGVGDRLGRTLGGAVWTVMNALACVFLLFYFFRDRDKAVGLVKFLIPASAKESDQLLKQVRDMIRSTLHGTLFVSAIQGLLGGLMFWFLGIPGALLWGVAMGLLSVVPILGAFVVWVPAAAFLAVQGEWMKAGILALWGVLVVGLIDNLLYPMLVGEQTRMHTVPMFLALLGGLAVFGAAGLVIGPIVLAFTWSLLQLLRKRMILHGEVLDRPTE